MLEPAMETPVNIFTYTDYRRFLNEFYLARKAQDRKFSHRFINQKVGASSSGWFSDILKGRINLSGNHLVRLAQALKLKAREAAYFEALVNYDQAGSLEEKNHHYRKILSFKEIKAELVGRDRFEFYSQWYFSAVRELLFFYEFKGDYATLARKLVPPIRPVQAKRSIDLLTELGMIRKEADGVFRPVTQTLKKDSSFKSVHTFNLLKANAELGVAALQKYDKERRDISALTLSLSSDGLQKAKEEIRALRKRLLALMHEDAKPDTVYQCNFQLFPLTQ